MWAKLFWHEHDFGASHVEYAGFGPRFVNDALHASWAPIICAYHERRRAALGEGGS